MNTKRSTEHQRWVIETRRSSAASRHRNRKHPTRAQRKRETRKESQ